MSRGKTIMPYTMDELEEFLRKDEEEIRRAVERIRKNPVKIKPDLKDFLDPDLFRLHAMSYNRHTPFHDSIKIDWEFRDKRFEEILGDDY